MAKPKRTTCAWSDLTSDPNGAYSYYGGAIVGSDNLHCTQCRERTISTPPVNNNAVYLDLRLGWK